MWLPSSKRRIFFDMHFPDWQDRQSATNFNPQEIVDTFARSHVDSVIFYGKCQFGNFYYNTKIGHKHNGLGQLDLFTEVFKGLKKKNIKAIAYYSVAWDELAAKEHPEWLVQDASGTPGAGGEFRWTTLCIHSPWREVVKAHLTEMTQVLKPDGYWIDMTIIGNKRCFCPYCQAKYKAETGFDLVEDAGENPAENQRFLQFRYDYIQAFYKEIYQLIRHIKPDCMISNNYWGYPYSSYTMGSRAIGATLEADYLTGEAYTDWTGLSAPGFFTKWLRSAAQGRPFEALIGRFVSTWDYTTKPATQLALEAYTVASNGGTVTIDDEPFADGSMDKELYQDIGEIFGKIKDREAYLDGKFLKNGAIFHSQKTKDHALATQENFIAGMAGSYRLLKEIGCPCEFLFDENITWEQLKPYDFVILSNVFILSQMERQLFERYVQEGGLLLCSGQTGLYELIQGRKTATATFSNWLGLNYQGQSDYSLAYYQMDRMKAQAYLDQVSSRPVLVRGAYSKYEVQESGCVLATIMDPICETTDKTFFHNNLPAPFEPTSFPAIIKQSMGKGHVFFFSQDIFVQFARYHQLEIKHFIKNILIEHHKYSQVHMSCSAKVEIAVAEMDNHQLIVHLINMASGTTVCAGAMDTFTAQYPRTFEFVDEIDPLYQIELTVQGRKITKAFSVDQQQELVIHQKADNHYVIIVDRLVDWETVVLDSLP